MQQESVCSQFLSCLCLGMYCQSTVLYYSRLTRRRSARLLEPFSSFSGAGGSLCSASVSPTHIDTLMVSTKDFAAEVHRLVAEPGPLSEDAARAFLSAHPLQNIFE